MFQSKVLVSWLILLSMFGGQDLVASAYQLWEQSANSVGYAHADMAALADDASTAWYNPAGMVSLCRPELALSGTFIDLRTQFKGQAGFANAAESLAYLSGDVFSSLPGQTLTPFRVPRAVGNTSPTFGGINMVYPLHCENFTLAFGLAIDSPFGLETDWRYSNIQCYATRSYLETIQINPSIAFGYGPFALAVGYGSQLARLELATSFFEIEGYVSLKNWENTWNIGALYTPFECTQVGLTYRPSVDHHLKGHSYILYTRTNDAHCLFKLPGTLTFGIKQQMNSCWDLLATVAWSHWSRVRNIEVSTGVNNIQSEIPGFSGDSLYFYTAFPNITLESKSTFLVAVGSKYLVNDMWTVKCGLAWDQSPIKNRYREFRVPDNDHYHLALGARCDFNAYVRMDAGLQYVYVPKCRVQNVPITQVPGLLLDGTGTPLPNQGSLIAPVAQGFSGSIESSAVVFSIQASVIFP